MVKYVNDILRQINTFHELKSDIKIFKNLRASGFLLLFSIAKLKK
jgi:hypothetical protein